MFTLTLKTDNAAFDDDPAPELARMLREVADKVEQQKTNGFCIDSNGNTVGRWSLR